MEQTKIDCSEYSESINIVSISPAKTKIFIVEDTQEGQYYYARVWLNNKNLRKLRDKLTEIIGD